MSKMNNTMEKVEISHRTIIFTVLFLGFLWIFYQIRGVIILLFIAFILMTALNPLVTILERYKIPRPLGIFLSFVFGIAIISLIIAGLVPPLIEQTGILSSRVADILEDSEVFKIDGNLLTSQIETISRNAVNLLGIVLSAASNILTIFSLIVLTFYLLIERKNLKHYLKVLFKDNNSEHQAEVLVDSFEKKLGGWVRGELMLMFIVGLLTYVGLTLLGIPFALPLALLAGLLELIPNIGPVIASIPAIITGLTISPMIAVGVAILYLAVQQLENHLIVPMVMKQSLGLPPLITLVSLMVGGALGGILGAILAVPVFITAEVVFRHVYKYRQEKRADPQ